MHGKYTNGKLRASIIESVLYIRVVYTYICVFVCVCVDCGREVKGIYDISWTCVIIINYSRYHILPFMNTGPYSIHQLTDSS